MAPKQRRGRAQPFKAGTYSHKTYRMTLVKDGEISAKPRDWLVSKFAACLYGDPLMGWEEFGRKDRIGNVVQLDEPGEIKAGEPIFHIPTYRAHKDSLARFFRVKVPPKKFVQEFAQAKSVVSERPWRQESVQFGGVHVTGRLGWGASDPIWKNEVVYYNTLRTRLDSLLSRTVIHHTNNNGSVKQVEEKEIREAGFAAIGYHFFIDRKGGIFQGRPLEVMGSHAGAGPPGKVIEDPDFGAVGIAMQGDYHKGKGAQRNLIEWGKEISRGEDPEHDEPTTAMLNSLKKLLSALKSRYGINQLKLHNEVHRTGTPTVCPGNILSPKVEAIRDELNLRP